MNWLLALVLVLCLVFGVMLVNTGMAEKRANPMALSWRLTLGIVLLGLFALGQQWKP